MKTLKRLAHFTAMLVFISGIITVVFNVGAMPIQNLTLLCLCMLGLLYTANSYT